MKRKNRGFTIIELMVIVGIIGALALLLLPALGKTRERGHMVKCMNNMRQLSMAALLYATDHNGMVPDIAPDPSNPDACLANSDYIDDEEVYVCPRDTRTEDEFGDFKTSYTATLFTPGAVFARGLSSLILYIESDQAGVLPRDQIDDLEKHCTARHGGISNITYADGSINSYNTQSIASLAKTVQAAAVTAGGRAVGRPSAPQRDTGGRRVGPEEAVSSAGEGPVAASTSSGGGSGQEDEPKPPKKLMSAGRYQEGDKEIVEYRYDDGSVERYEYDIDTGGTDTGGGGDDDFDPARTADLFPRDSSQSGYKDPAASAQGGDAVDQTSGQQQETSTGTGRRGAN